MDMKFKVSLSIESEAWPRVCDALSQVNIVQPDTVLYPGVGVLESILHGIADEFWNGAFSIPKGSGVPLTLRHSYCTEREFVLGLIGYAEIIETLTLKKNGILVVVTRIQ